MFEWCTVYAGHMIVHPHLLDKATCSQEDLTHESSAGESSTKCSSLLLFLHQKVSVMSDFSPLKYVRNVVTLC